MENLGSSWRRGVTGILEISGGAGKWRKQEGGKESGVGEDGNGLGVGNVGNTG